ncbi:phage tail sheath family protein [Desulfocurvibacter africanus]|uniref:Phage tail protein n=1 Tax=Desulfocurvibacter africanus subsp. africanus str. Walvis Bay TaxID=690850 RepID=F3YY71_DESAF|nr:phage tail protein [Desulfocurvibacter africanus]EGJ51847.1 hypothetical protein Desaf_3567 [Desulfocurvibacter africanus subsp. africanus str. Walvis Bay]
MSYKHGVYASEIPTSLLPPRSVSAGLIVAFGSAPVQLLDAGKPRPVNQPVLCSTYEEFVDQLGWSDDLSAYTLCEVAKVAFGLYGVGPLVCINVFDPSTHKTAVAAEAVTLNALGTAQLAHAGLVANPVVSSQDGLTTYVLGTDYTVNLALGTITRTTGSAIAAGASLQVSYEYGDPSKVTGNDVIGGVDAETGKRTGLELVHEVFPRLRLVPGQILAPRFSMQAGVAIAMDAKCEGINSLFRAIALVDIDDTTVSKYSDAPLTKETNNLTSENLVVCWPKVSVNGIEHHLSTHLAALMASIDADNDDIPYRSPSNNRLLIEGAKAAGTDVYLGLDQANYLNGQGIITAINWDGGWKAWGNRTAAYPSVTDPKDAWIPIRRFFGWYANRLILTYFQKVDWPIRRRLIQTIVDSENVNLNGLTSREIINGGRVTFLEAENPVTDIMDGVLRFHVYLNPPAPARDIEFVLEYDPSYLQALFG